VARVSGIAEGRLVHAGAEQLWLLPTWIDAPTLALALCRRARFTDRVVQTTERNMP
jgi:hypothetical protein